MKLTPQKMEAHTLVEFPMGKSGPAETKALLKPPGRVIISFIGKVESGKSWVAQEVMKRLCPESKELPVPRPRNSEFGGFTTDIQYYDGPGYRFLDTEGFDGIPSPDLLERAKGDRSVLDQRSQWMEKHLPQIIYDLSDVIVVVGRGTFNNIEEYLERVSELALCDPKKPPPLLCLVPNVQIEDRPFNSKEDERLLYSQPGLALVRDTHFSGLVGVRLPYHSSAEEPLDRLVNHIIKRLA